MKFKTKVLSCAIALALGGASVTAWSAPKLNTKAFWLSGTKTDLGVAIAGKKTGKFLAVWSTSVYDPDLGEDKTYVYSRYTDKGAGVGDKFQLTEVNGSEAIDIGAQNVAMNSDGDAVVCWKADNIELGAPQVACRFVPSGSNSGIDTPIIPVSASGQVSGIRVAMDDSGKFLVVWQDADNANTVMAQRFAADGSVEDDEFIVADQSKADEISVAMDTDGDAVVAWTAPSEPGVFALRVDKNGDVAEDKIRVDSTPADDINESDNRITEYVAQFPSVAMDSSGNFAVAWERMQVDTRYDKDDVATTTRATGIFAQRFDTNDNALNRNKKQPTVVEDITLHFNKKQFHVSPEIAMDSAGNFVASWQQSLTKQSCYTDELGYRYCQDVEVGNNILARKFNKRTKKLEAEKLVVKSTKQSEYNMPPSVALLDDGSFQVGWVLYDYYDDNDELIGAMKATARLYKK